MLNWLEDIIYYYEVIGPANKDERQNQTKRYRRWHRHRHLALVLAPGIVIANDLLVPRKHSSIQTTTPRPCLSVPYLDYLSPPDTVIWHRCDSNGSAPASLFLHQTVQPTPECCAGLLSVAAPCIHSVVHRKSVRLTREPHVDRPLPKSLNRKTYTLVLTTPHQKTITHYHSFATTHSLPLLYHDAPVKRLSLSRPAR